MFNLPITPDLVWTVCSLAWTAIAVIFSVIPAILATAVLIQTRGKNPVLYDDDDFRMSIFEALNYDSYAEDYFEGGKAACIKARSPEIWKMFGKFLFVSLLAKSAIAVASFVLLYAFIHTVDGALMEYFFENYYEVDEDEST